MVTDQRAVVALATTLTLWACAFVAIRIALPGLGVIGLSVGRLVVASATLATAVPVFGLRRPARSDLARIACCGLTGMTGYQLLLIAGERSVPAGTASLLVNTGPIFAALLAFALLREPLTRRTWLGVALGFAGATVMTLSQGGGLRPSADALLVLAAAMSQALFFVMQKPLLSRYSDFEVTCYATWSGTIFAMPLLAAAADELSRASAESLAAVLFLGVGPSAIGFFTWAYTQRRVPVAAAANTLYLVPFLAIGIGWIALHETVHPTALAGGLLALVGVAISRRAPRETDNTRRGDA
jgi:drug/metabolite transporter (DMT)-like permease